MDFDEAIEESIKSFYSGKPFKAMEELIQAIWALFLYPCAVLDSR